MRRDDLDALEWSFDTVWHANDTPAFVDEFLSAFSSRHSLYGHGVYLSMFSGAWSDHHVRWMDNLAIEVEKHQYTHISEHFGFSVTNHVEDNAPLPVPMNQSVLELTKPRIQQFNERSQTPVGLENLAFAFTSNDVLTQGQFLGDIVSSVDGFLLLDLHNLYCQLINFQIDPLTLLQSYPAHLVRELHVSGGSWSEINSTLIRRDTHDQAIEEGVLMLLKMALTLFPNVEVVIFERLLGTLSDKKSQQQFITDFLSVKGICHDI